MKSAGNINVSQQLSQRLEQSERLLLQLDEARAAAKDSMSLWRERGEITSAELARKKRQHLEELHAKRSYALLEALWRCIEPLVSANLEVLRDPRLPERAALAVNLHRGAMLDRAHTDHTFQALVVGSAGITAQCLRWFS